MRASQYTLSLSLFSYSSRGEVDLALSGCEGGLPAHRLAELRQVYLGLTAACWV
jgi:hypothetical protein